MGLSIEELENFQECSFACHAICSPCQGMVVLCALKLTSKRLCRVVSGDESSWRAMELEKWRWKWKERMLLQLSVACENECLV